MRAHPHGKELQVGYQNQLKNATFSIKEYKFRQSTSF